ncbi:hypothetical protein QQP08_004844 [Theobroma cacao]|nr:hypothetical protein QQP08_004844 [Theobroma cacao]
MAKSRETNMDVQALNCGLDHEVAFKPVSLGMVEEWKSTSSPMKSTPWCNMIRSITVQQRHKHLCRIGEGKEMCTNKG